MSLLLLLAALVAAAAPSSVAAQLGNLGKGGGLSLGGGSDEHVRASLIADHTTIAPGQTFRLGVRYDIDRAWHIYWHNSGEAGFQTSVDFTLPAGFEAGPLRWPAPYRFDEAGDIMTYGYKDEVVLWTEVTAPDALEAGATLDFAARTDWLMCKEICIPDDAKPTLSLAVVADGAEPEQSSEHEKFDHFGALTPPEIEVADDGAATASDTLALTFLATPDGDDSRLVIAGRVDAAWGTPADDRRGRTLTFFADESMLFLNERSTASIAEDGSFVVSIGMTEPAAAGLEIGGVLVVPRAPLPEDTPPAPETAANNDQPYFEAYSVAFTLADAQIAADQDALAARLAEAGSSADIAAAASSGALGSLDALLGDTDYREQNIGWLARLGLFGQLAIAFLGGLILNIMPCVLPVISFKVLGIVRQGGEDPRRVFRLGLVFALGIWVSFMALAIPIAALVAAGRVVGWGEIFQSPVFLVSIYVVLIVFGLSLLGVYEINLPGFAQDKIQGASGGEGYGGSFMNGCLATVLATPCMGPFVGPAIGYSFTQSPGFIIAMFTMLALGLAFPYLILTIRPSWMKWLPKPGDWMENVKILMGLAIIGAAIFPFHVMTEQAKDIDGNGTAIDAFQTSLLVFTFALTLAVFIVGRFVTLLTPLPRKLVIYAFALLIAGGSFMMLIRGPIQWIQAGELPDGRIEWVEFTPDALSEQIAAGQTVFVDFTAEWCITCKFNEKWVIDTTDVREALNREGVVAMKADWTLRDETITELLARFGAPGVPFYVVFSPDAPPKSLGETITQSEVIGAIDDALAGS